MLQEIYDIGLEGESLADLRRRQEEEKARFDLEKADARALWEREKKAREERLKAEDAEIGRKREWERDEYDYQVKVRKQRDADALAAELGAKRAGFEGEIRGRQRAVAEREAAVRGGEAGRTRRGIARFRRKDADTYPEFGLAVGKLCRFAKHVIDRPAPDPTSFDPRELWQLARIGKVLHAFEPDLRYLQFKLMTMSALEFLDLFFEDLSGKVIKDDVFARLLTFPNVLVTGHQAFFTHEALTQIAGTTLQNVTEFEKTGTCENKVETNG